MKKVCWSLLLTVVSILSLLFLESGSVQICRNHVSLYLKFCQKVGTQITIYRMVADSFNNAVEFII